MYPNFPESYCRGFFLLLEITTASSPTWPLMSKDIAPSKWAVAARARTAFSVAKPIFSSCCNFRDETDDFGNSIFLSSCSVVYCNDAKIPARNIWSSSACVSDVITADCCVWGDVKDSNWEIRRDDASAVRGRIRSSDLMKKKNLYCKLKETFGVNQ